MLNVLRINWYLHRGLELVGLFFALVSFAYVYLFATAHRNDLVLASAANLIVIVWWSLRMSKHAIKAKHAFHSKLSEYERLYGNLP